jgi:hypothetical protein
VERAELRQQMFQQWRLQTSAVAGTGFFVGGVTGLGAALFGATPEDALNIMRGGYQVLMPLALSAMFLLTLVYSLSGAFRVGNQPSPRRMYHHLGAALLVTIVAAIGGSVGGTMLFVFPALNLPLLLRGYEGGAFYTTAGQWLLPNGLLIMTGCVLIVALVATVWAHYWMDED